MIVSENVSLAIILAIIFNGNVIIERSTSIMKRRSLALFLAILMAFGSILPVFATEPAVEAVAEEQTPTLTYEDLYVPGAVFAWDALDRKSVV